MSHDFPDGPDFNPEPLDDDPWDVDTTSYPPEAVRCVRCEGYELPGYGHAIGCPHGATEADISATDDTPDL